MRRVATFLLLVLAAAPSCAQLLPMSKSPRPVEDAAMVIDDRGASLEVYRAKRAAPASQRSGKSVAHAVYKTTASASIGPRQLGVVFNHSMQVQGYITGEIGFKLKDGRELGARFSAEDYPGLKLLRSPNVFFVVARTPEEFVTLVARLKSRDDVAWVEPMVIY